MGKRFYQQIYMILFSITFHQSASICSREKNGVVISIYLICRFIYCHLEKFRIS